jgi:hypothetical protein
MKYGRLARAGPATVRGPLKAQPLAVEPISDIAVLGALDGDEFFEEAAVFEQWCAETPPVPVCLEPLPPFDPFPIYIPTHTGTWLQGSAQLAREDVHQLWIETFEQIEQGTSGSPIHTGRGELVGIVSNASVMSPGGVCHGLAPLPLLTLPAWIARRIQVEQASAGTSCC